MGRCSYSRKGFTLIELLIATIIMLLIAAGALGIYIMSLTVWKEGGVQIALQRKASMVMEKMVRGVDGRDGIREAKSASCPDNTTIQYTSGIDDKTRKFYLEDKDEDGDCEIYYDDPDMLSDLLIAENIKTSPSGLTFTESGNIVTINLSMEEQVMDNTITIDLSTLVNLRN